MLSRKLIKYIQSLSHKKFRDAHEVFLAEGPKIILEFLTSNRFKCELICALPQWIDQLGSDVTTGVDVHSVDEIMLGRLSTLSTPNQVLGVFQKRAGDTSPDLNNKLTLMLDDIKDPGNFGSIIRTADWFGVKNLICSFGSVDCYNPKVVQGSMGSLSRVSILYTDLKEFLAKYPKIKVYAATLSGSSIYKISNFEEGIVIIGNESAGVSQDLLNIATHQVAIPRFGNAESLNASVAVGIILSHLTAK